jgi:hypothetical protein
MNRRMLKYPVSLSSDTIHDVQGEPKLCAMQDGVAMLWFERIDGAPGRNVTFRIFPTGAHVPDGWEHYGSAVDGPYVWHVYGRSPA